MHQIQLLKKYGLSVRGARGQHLLIDENIQRKFVALVNPQAGERIIEIGPGLGAVTEPLLKSGAEIIAIEQDERFVQVLKGELGEDFKNLKLVHADILKTDLKKYAEGEYSLRVCGNIPYYITSGILLYLIAHRRWIDSAYLTVQSEIADRIFAQPGTKDYGRLSLLLRFYTDPRRAFEISRHCFSPEPDVDSTTIAFTFRRKLPDSFDEQALFDLIQAGFSGRRKNILNALTNGWKGRMTKPAIEAALKASGIEPTARAEQLMLKDFIRLAEKIN